MAAMIRVASRLLPLLFLSARALAATLPDTGQTMCDNGSNVLVACTNANTGDNATYPRQDGRFGRDANAAAATLAKIGGGPAGFDYTKIANNGADLGAGPGLALGYNPNDWACTRDNNTGLTWEIKVVDSLHLRHRDWSYSWYNSDFSTNGGFNGNGNIFPSCKTLGRCDTEKFVADVNASVLCGNTGWRLPTARELLTLVHAGAQLPAIVDTYFPYTYSSEYWSDSTSPEAGGSFAWTVLFFDGSLSSGHKDNLTFVRLVRGGRF